VALFALVAVVGLDVAATNADHRHHHSYATPPASHSTPRRPARTAQTDTASTEADSAGSGTRTLSLNDTYHAPSGCADRPTAAHDDIWDNW
jgi:hypothetical protein